MKKLLFYIFLLSTIIVHCQNMNQGFDYLEKGNFKMAENFFYNILNEYPNNRTANICYARAVGLNGKPQKALNILLSLQDKYYNDYEIKLNYAEALLWNQQFLAAKENYKRLIESKPQNFSALLGYANTLSRLKEYEEALEYINKALLINPLNESALKSKKYINLDFAYLQEQNQNYYESEKLLKKNLIFFKNDKETLKSLANLYLIMGELDQAFDIYHDLYKISSGQNIALNGLSLIAHLRGNNKKALELSGQSYQKISLIKDSIIINQTKERYVQSLIWNSKFKESELLINELLQKKPVDNWILALRATLNIYLNNFKRSLKDYNLILQKKPSSFDGNLGKANAFKGLNFIDSAYFYANQTLKYYPNQKDAATFIEKLDNSFAPFSEIKTKYSFDNGKNEAHSLNTFLKFPLSTKFNILANHNYRKVSNSIFSTNGSLNEILAGFSHQITPSLNILGKIGVISTNTKVANYSQFVTDLLIQTKPTSIQNLQFGYKREVQNFNIDLLNREIVQNHFYSNYNINTSLNIGWFAQYYYTNMSDNNNRNLFFTSLYYDLFKNPSLKVGLNYQYISFKEQFPSIYFSPIRFSSIEVFTNVLRNENTITASNSWFYELTAATGLQYIEDNKQQGTYRFQGVIGYKFSNRSLIDFYGTHSNIASTTAVGFTYTEAGFRFKYLLSKKPIFR